MREGLIEELRHYFEEVPLVLEAADELEKQNKINRMKFILNGCDISFIAEAPEDMTVKQLVRQGDRIEPDWCACGICSAEKREFENHDPEIIFDYDDVQKANEDVSCRILPKKGEAEPEPFEFWNIDQEWLRVRGETRYICSGCLTIWTPEHISNMHYCPTCGAHMKVNNGE